MQSLRAIARPTVPRLLSQVHPSPILAAGRQTSANLI